MTFEEANSLLRAYHYGEKGGTLQGALQALEVFGINNKDCLCESCEHVLVCEAPKYPNVYICNLYVNAERPYKYEKQAF